MTYQAILFDLDDTLLDSMPARVMAISRVFASAGIADLQPEKFMRDLNGTPLEAALIKLAAEFRLDADLFEEYRQIYWNKEKGLIRLYPGVTELIKKLRNQDLKLGLVTTKSMKFNLNGASVGAMTELAELGMADVFEAIVGYEDVTLRKPHPEAVHLALSRLNLTPDKAIMVGDSTSDIKAAQAAGCLACYATWGLPEQERNNLLSIVTPDFILDSPDDLLRLVG